MTNKTEIERSDRLDEAFGCYLRQVEEQGRPDVDSLLHEYADIATQLKSCIATVEEVQKMAGPTWEEEQEAARSIDTAKTRGLFETMAGGGRATLAFAPLKSGRVFGRYRIERLLGQGAMGAVYLAHDMQLDRQVALKLPRFTGDPEEMTNRFYREAQAAATLRSQHICPVYDVGVHEGLHYISMAYIDGEPLVCRRVTPKPASTHDEQPAEGAVSSTADTKLVPRPADDRAAVDLVRKVALALQKAHAAGVIHRDLKPGNIMIDRDGEPIVMDFGLARRLDDDTRVTQSGALVGSPAYMSPEQVEGKPEKIGPATDVYALGVILFELLTGRLPYEGGIMSVLGQIAHGPSPRVAEHRPDLAGTKLEAVCEKMMAKPVEVRYPSMEAVADGLAHCKRVSPKAAVSEGGATTTAQLPSTPKSDATRYSAKARKWVSEKPAFSGRSAFYIALAVLLPLVLLAGGVIVYFVTDNGTIVVESPSDELKLVVMRDGAEVDSVDLKRDQPTTLRLRSGTYEVELRGGGEFEIARDNTIIVKRGGKVPIRIRPRTAGGSPGSIATEITEVKRLEGHTDALTGVAWPTPDRVVSCSHASVGVWDVETGKLLLHLKDRLPPGSKQEEGGRLIAPSWAFGFAASRDGKYAASGHYHGIVCIWDLAAGKQLLRIPAHWGGDQDHSSAYGLAFTPDSRMLVTGGVDGWLRWWDVETGTLQGEYEFNERVRALAMHPDGARVLAGSFGGKLAFVDLGTNKPVREFKTDGVYSLAISPDGRLAVSGSNEDNPTRVWDLESGKLKLELKGQTDTVESVAFTPDGRYILCGTNDRKLRMWDVQTGGEVAERTTATHATRYVAVSPDGRRLVTGGGKHWDYKKRGLSSDGDNALRIWKLTESVWPKSAELRVLDRYSGVWQMETTESPTRQFPRAVTTKHAVHGGWTLGGRFHQSYWTSDSGDEEWLVLRGYDESSAAYRIFLFGSPGTFFERRGNWDESARTMQQRVVPPAPGVSGAAADKFVNEETMESSLLVKNGQGVVTRDVEGTASRVAGAASFEPKSSGGPADDFEELAVLQRLAGRWSVDHQSKPSALDPKGHDQHLTEEVDWILGGRFLRSRTIDGQGNLFAQYLMTWDEASRAYRIWHFEFDGSVGLWRAAWEKGSTTFTWRALDTPPGWIGTMGTVRFVDEDTSVLSIVIKDEQDRVLLEVRQERKRLGADASTNSVWPADAGAPADPPASSGQQDID